MKKESREKESYQRSYDFQTDLKPYLHICNVYSEVLVFAQVVYKTYRSTLSLLRLKRAVRDSENQKMFANLEETACVFMNSEPL